MIGGDAFGRLVYALDGIGQTGVDLFFVLSGYLIYGALLRGGQPIRAFLRRRAVRIYPALMVVLTLYTVLALIFDPEQRLPRDPVAIPLYLLANALLLPGMLPITPLITVAWSLSYEAFFYFAAPLVVRLLGLRDAWPAARLRRLLAFTAAATMVVAVAPGYARLLLFTAGMVLFELNQLVVPRAWPLGLLAAAAIVMVIPNIPVNWHYAGWRTATLWISMTALCLDALHWRTLTARLLEWTPLRWLGNMSYSYYLLHGLTLKASFMAARMVVTEIPAPVLWFWLLLPVAFGLTLLPAATLFVFVEKPYSFPRPSPAPAPVDAGFAAT